MPEPTNKVTVINPNFDPDYHCGAKTRSGSTCMNRSGFKTPHVGEGRCFRHGGLGGRKKGGVIDMKIMRSTFEERVEEYQNDPELLTLDREIAIVKVIIDAKLAAYSEQYEDWLRVQEQLDDPMFAPEDGSIPELPPIPELSISELDQLNKLVRTAFEMKYARRHSIPIEELQSIIVQLAKNFNDVMEVVYRGIQGGEDARRVVEIAKEAFVQSLSELRMSRAYDPKLDRAAGVRGGMPGQQADGSLRAKPDVRRVGPGLESPLDDQQPGAVGALASAAVIDADSESGEDEE